MFEEFGLELPVAAIWILGLGRWSLLLIAMLVTFQVMHVALSIQLKKNRQHVVYMVLSLLFFLLLATMLFLLFFCINLPLAAIASGLAN